MSKNIEGVGEVTTPATPKEKLQNFWYHYKWHSLVAVFLVIAILICSLMCFILSKQISRKTSQRIFLGRYGNIFQIDVQSLAQIKRYDNYENFHSYAVK